MTSNGPYERLQTLSAGSRIDEAHKQALAAFLKARPEAARRGSPVTVALVNKAVDWWNRNLDSGTEAIR